MKVVDLCCGAGGLSIGFERAGFEHILLVDSDRNCCNTIKANRPEWNVFHGTINDAKFPDDVDIVVGGPPCQGFSVAGKRDPEDSRSAVVWDFLNAAEEMNPSFVLMENVAGLGSYEDGKMFNDIIQRFYDMGYSQVTSSVLTSWDYGVAQKRQRLFIVASNSSYEFPEPYSYKPVLRDVLQGVPDSIGASYSEKKKKVLDLVPAGGCWVDLPLEVQKKYMGKTFFNSGGRRGVARRISWDEPCLTVLTNPGQKQTDRCHPDETRPFTVRESARIQSFPDEWIFAGSMSSQYKQIGNAVPPNLAHCLALNFL
tara:strand:+ start:1340 stop:2275 length:936 start_codon:yes stop_codon:yes gene_type:complete